MKIGLYGGVAQPPHLAMCRLGRSLRGFRIKWLTPLNTAYGAPPAANALTPTAQKSTLLNSQSSPEQNASKFSISGKNNPHRTKPNHPTDLTKENIIYKINNIMNNNEIFLQLADGQLFPLFQNNNQSSCNLTLSPATQGQDRIDFQIFQHLPSGKKTIPLGVFKLENLPTTEKIEIQFNAHLDKNNIFLARASHIDTGKTTVLEVPIKSITGSGHTTQHYIPQWKKQLHWTLGSLLITGILIILTILALRITNWGQQKPGPVPMIEQGYNPNQVGYSYSVSNLYQVTGTS